jgi:glycosyltransferase involved in cell wall biosynthesis
VKISVIVPTYNEEEYLPKLLDCLGNQTMERSEFEVIVADADSTDRTAVIAREWGATVVPGGLPAVGRNAGAEAAQGDYYFFFDADVKFSKHLLEEAYSEMQERYIDIATCEARPLSNVALDRLMHNFANLYLKVNQYTNPVAPGYCILITSRLFHRVGGFDENVTHAEDFDLVRRASELRPFRVLENVHITLSVRRYRKEGRLAFIGHSIAVSFHRTFKGEITDEDYDYEFGAFDEKSDESQLRKLERRINKLDRRYNRLAKKFRNRKAGESPNQALTNKLKGIGETVRGLYDQFTSSIESTDDSTDPERPSNRDSR